MKDRKPLTHPTGWQIHPGQVYHCNFAGLEPEFDSGHPALVISSKWMNQHRFDLVTVVPFSTRRPISVQPYHLKLEGDANPIPGRKREEDISWIKSDMAQTVAIGRLTFYRHDGKDLMLNLPMELVEEVRAAVALSWTHETKGHPREGLLAPAPAPPPSRPRPRRRSGRKRNRSG